MRLWIWAAAVNGFLAVALLWGRVPGGRMAPRSLRLAGWGFCAGTLLFSGALYIMGMTGLRALGMVVPVGGILLLGGWAALFAYGLGLRGRSET